jgi:hypothetical protein
MKLVMGSIKQHCSRYIILVGTRCFYSFFKKDVRRYSYGWTVCSLEYVIYVQSGNTVQLGVHHNISLCRVRIIICVLS